MTADALAQAIWAWWGSLHRWGDLSFGELGGPLGEAIMRANLQGSTPQTSLALEFMTGLVFGAHPRTPKAAVAQVRSWLVFLPGGFGPRWGWGNYGGGFVRSFRATWYHHVQWLDEHTLGFWYHEYDLPTPPVKVLAEREEGWYFLDFPVVLLDPVCHMWHWYDYWAAEPPPDKPVGWYRNTCPGEFTTRDNIRGLVNPGATIPEGARFTDKFLQELGNYQRGQDDIGRTETTEADTINCRNPHVFRNYGNGTFFAANSRLP